jgi:hypothetical protein
VHDDASRVDLTDHTDELTIGGRDPHLGAGVSQLGEHAREGGIDAPSRAIGTATGPAASGIVGGGIVEQSAK